MQELFSPGEVANIHGVPTDTVLAAIARGELAARRYNSRVIRITRGDLERWTEFVIRSARKAPGNSDKSPQLRATRA